MPHVEDGADRQMISLAESYPADVPSRRSSASQINDPDSQQVPHTLPDFAILQKAQGSGPYRQRAVGYPKHPSPNALAERTIIYVNSHYVHDNNDIYGCTYVEKLCPAIKRQRLSLVFVHGDFHTGMVSLQQLLSPSQQLTSQQDLADQA
jgi:hypothetical protein